MAKQSASSSQKFKTKPAAKTLAKTAVSKTLIDQYGSLADQIEKADAKIKPYREKLDKLMAQILEQVDKATPAEQARVLTGNTHAIEFGAKGNSTEITDKVNAGKMLEAIEKGLALKLATFSITDLRSYLTPDQFEKVTYTERSRKRRATVKKVV